MEFHDVEVGEIVDQADGEDLFTQMIDVTNVESEAIMQGTANATDVEVVAEGNTLFSIFDKTNLHFYKFS